MQLLCGTGNEFGIQFLFKETTWALTVGWVRKRWRRLLKSYYNQQTATKALTFNSIQKLLFIEKNNNI